MLPDGSLRTARPDGTLLRSESAPARRGAAWEQSFSMRAGERMCGLGEQASGIDLRGATSRCGTPTPVVRGARGRARCTSASPSWCRRIPTATCSRSTRTRPTPPSSSGEPGGHRRTRPGTATVRFAGGVLRRYLVAGPVPHLLDRYSELTGRPALPPRWALGYHQSRWGYRREADVRAITDGFAKLGIPLSAVHLDIDYMRGFRVFTVDPDRFPDLGRLAARRGGHRGAPGDDRRRRREDRPRLRRVPRGPRPAPVLHRRPRAPGRRRGLARAQRLPRLHRSRHPDVVGGEVPHAHRRRRGGDLARHERAHLDRVARRPDPAHLHPPSLRRPRAATTPRATTSTGCS